MVASIAYKEQTSVSAAAFWLHNRGGVMSVIRRTMPTQVRLLVRCETDEWAAWRQEVV